MTRSELRRVFTIAADYFKLSPEARKMAWDVAIAKPEYAYQCYAAIARSLAPRSNTGALRE